MRASELLACEVVDGRGQSLGPVRDVRVVRPDASEASGWTVAGIVVGDGPFAEAAHAWGFAEGRARGPWLLRAVTARAVRRATFVPAGRVAEWGPSTIRLCDHGPDLRPLQEVL